MKVEGFKRSNFNSSDGSFITGYNLFVSYPLSGDGVGMACDRLYMTDDKLAKCGYTPQVGDEVSVTYNKYGKAAAIIPVKR